MYFEQCCSNESTYWGSTSPEPCCDECDFGYVKNTETKTESCPNFEVCGSKHPRELLECWHELCLNCDMFFRGKLIIVDSDSECPICLDVVNRKVSYPGGCHYFCISCFRKLFHMGEDDEDGKSSVLCPCCRQDINTAPNRTWRYSN